MIDLASSRLGAAAAGAEFDRTTAGEIGDVYRS